MRQSARLQNCGHRHVMPPFPFECNWPTPPGNGVRRPCRPAAEFFGQQAANAKDENIKNPEQWRISAGLANVREIFWQTSRPSRQRVLKIIALETLSLLFLVITAFSNWIVSSDPKSFLFLRQVLAVRSSDGNPRNSLRVDSFYEWQEPFLIASTCFPHHVKFE